MTYDSSQETGFVVHKTEGTKNVLCPKMTILLWS